MAYFRVLPILAASLAVTAPAAIDPAWAAVDTQDPGRFIDSLADTAFTAYRSGSPATARATFRSILARHFDAGAIGDRLIQRQRNKITPAQYAQYKAAFPGFITATYGDRLAGYANADLKVVRVAPAGAGAAVLTTVTQPGRRPANVTWIVSRVGGAYRVTNLLVSGVNLGLAQQADFDSLVQRRGFDALVAFMKSRG